MSAPALRMPMPGAIVERLSRAAARAPLRPVVGRVTKVTGTIVEAALANARVGDLCLLRMTDAEGSGVFAEIVGLREGVALLSVMGETSGICARSRITPLNTPLNAPVGRALLGRVLDGLGRPLDVSMRGALLAEGARAVDAPPPHPLARSGVSQPFALGIPCIDALLTCGEGQRIGIFGEPGTGKSTLMSAIAKAATADVAVIAMVGERGREVSEFLEDALGPEGLARSVVIAATSDRPAMERLKAPFVATAIAEGFRDMGLKVVLLMDSLTRLARAQREIGLAAGEPPARRAFPPSVFALMPKLIERAGATPDRGSITAFYTVLMEDEGVGDPVAEEARALLDGHIVLSRKIAESGRFPAIDALASRSRVMDRVVPEDHRRAAERLRALMARYKDVELLVRMGEHRHGADPFADEAIVKNESVLNFLHQDLRQPRTLQETLQGLNNLAFGSVG